MRRPSPLFLTLLASLLFSCSTSPSTSSTGSVTNSSTNPLEIGYITRMYEQDGRRKIDVDSIEWLTGETATLALREDDPSCDQDGRSCEPPNGFYVRNDSATIEALILSSGVQIAMQTMDPAHIVSDQIVSFTEFREVVARADGRTVERFHLVPFWFQRDADGTITMLREQYVP